ncbi:MAG: hypothetical protein KDB90_03585 [Planctomycetes bacterium]|nr:hypothetical protein [Planctomycetota bacterium]
MMLLIVEYIPYVAFTAAAGLVAWVTADVLRSRKRATAKAPEAAQDSGRGLAGPAQPLATLRPEAEEAVDSIAEEAAEEAPELAPPEELELPVSQARDLSAEEETGAEAEAPAEVTEESETADDAPVVAAEVIPVRRDPSVRVFDTAVAPSERKVMSADD